MENTEDVSISSPSASDASSEVHIEQEPAGSETTAHLRVPGAGEDSNAKKHVYTTIAPRTLPGPSAPSSVARIPPVSSVFVDRNYALPGAATSRATAIAPVRDAPSYSPADTVTRHTPAAAEAPSKPSASPRSTGRGQAKQKKSSREADARASKGHGQETRSSPKPSRADRSEAAAEAKSARRVQREELKREDLSLHLQAQSLKEEKLSRQQDRVLRLAELSLLKRSRGAPFLKGRPTTSHRENEDLHERLKDLQGRVSRLQQQASQTQDQRSSQAMQQNHDVLRQEVRQLQEALQETRQKQARASERLDLEEKIESRGELQKSKREDEELRAKLLDLQGTLRLLTLDRRRDLDLGYRPQRQGATGIAPPSPDRKAAPSDHGETSPQPAEAAQGGRTSSPSHSASVEHLSEETMALHPASSLRPRTVQGQLWERVPMAHKKDRHALYRAHRQETVKRPSSRKMKLVRVSLPPRKSESERPTRAASSAQGRQQESEDRKVLHRMDEEVS